MLLKLYQLTYFQIDNSMSKTQIKVNIAIQMFQNKHFKLTFKTKINQNDAFVKSNSQNLSSRSTVHVKINWSVHIVMRIKKQ